MIDETELTTSVIIFHHNDNDGRLAAWLFSVYNSKLNPTFMEVDYRQQDKMPYCPEGYLVVIVDFSFNRTIMEHLAKRPEGLFWFDHHETLKEKFEGFHCSGTRDFTGQKSAAMLVFEFFNQSDPLRPFIRLVDDYDTWKLKDEDSKPFMYGSLNYNTSPDNEEGIFWCACWRDPMYVRKIIKEGQAILSFCRQQGKEAIENVGWIGELEGYMFYILNNPFRGSDWFRGVQNYGVDGFARVVYDGAQWEVSLYSEIANVGDIAKKHGGGGHRNAAGFHCQDINQVFIKKPNFHLTVYPEI